MMMAEAAHITDEKRRSSSSGELLQNEWLCNSHRSAAEVCACSCHEGGSGQVRRRVMKYGSR